MNERTAKIVGKSLGFLLVSIVVFGPPTVAAVLTWLDEPGVPFGERLSDAGVVFLIVLFVIAIVLKFIALAREVLGESEKS